MTQLRALCAAALFACGCTAHSAAPSVSGTALAPASYGSLAHLERAGDVWLAGQPSAADLENFARDGVKTVINLRRPEENQEFDEPALLAKLGVRYVNAPFASPAELTDGVFDAVRAALKAPDRGAAVLHCHSGNRVGAVWLAHRVLDDGLGYEAALAEARAIGLKAPALEERARQYVEAHGGAR